MLMGMSEAEVLRAYSGNGTGNTQFVIRCPVCESRTVYKFGVVKGSHSLSSPATVRVLDRTVIKKGEE